MRRRYRKLTRSFFTQPGDALAESLIGKILARATAGGGTRRARIVETEAYMGPGDLASHSSKGRTRRTEVMFGPAGHAYVYLCYGLHLMLNVVGGKTGEAHAVLLRAAEPLDGWDVNLTGPGNLGRGFAITMAENGIDLTGPTLFFQETLDPRPSIGISPRIGVDYAQKWKDAPLRFFDAGSRAVSRMRGTRVR